MLAAGPCLRDRQASRAGGGEEEARAAGKAQAGQRKWLGRHGRRRMSCVIDWGFDNKRPGFRGGGEERG